MSLAFPTKTTSLGMFCSIELSESEEEFDLVKNGSPANEEVSPFKRKFSKLTMNLCEMIETYS